MISGGKSFSKTCNLRDDQANSLQGKWTTLPIPVKVHSGDFNSFEVGEMQAAVKTWNEFFNFSKGSDIIDMPGDADDLNQTNPTCTGSTISNGVLIYKRQSTWTRSESAVAVTTFCTAVQSGSKIPRMYNAIIEINYRDFFGGTSGRIPDMQSIALHELGHLIGLDHSCGALRSGLPNASCPEIGSSDEIGQSVMYPAVAFDASGTGEQKRKLKTNDQNRANCIYE